MSEFNTIASLLGIYQQTDVEKKLMERWGPDATDKAQQFAAQWSQLVAWSWLEPDDYEEQEKPSQEQENLRQELIAVVKELARYGIAEHYCPGMFVEDIKTQSALLSQYLNGDTPESGLTLPKLYYQLTNRYDYAFQKEFTQSLVWLVTVDRFHGWLAGYNETEDKFVMVLAYPPRPALSASVLQVSELRDWSQGKGDGGYTPPNPYIPMCFC